MQKFVVSPLKLYLTVFLFIFFVPLQGQEVHQVALKELFPTQMVISHLQVSDKLEKYHKNPSFFFEDVNETPRKTAVIGPGQKYYLTDGHHTFSAMYDFHLAGPEYRVPVEITYNLSHLSDDEFWKWMTNQHLTWLNDGHGRVISHMNLPKNLGKSYLKDDQFRGAMYYLRGHFWNKPSPAIPFIEFYWAQYFRKVPELQIPEVDTQIAYMEWLKRIADHMRQIPHHMPIGPDGQGPDLLGRIELNTHAQPVFDFAYQYGNDGTVVAVIEIPTGSDEKWEHDKNNAGSLVWEQEGEDRRRIDYLPYPFNYGSVPGTLSKKELGGDGDPKDVIVLGKALPQGALLNVRIIGRLKMLDNGEQDDKLIAVLPNTLPFSSLNNMDQLAKEYPGIKEIISTWFLNYKGEKGRITNLEFTPCETE